MVSRLPALFIALSIALPCPALLVICTRIRIRIRIADTDSSRRQPRKRKSITFGRARKRARRESGSNGVVQRGMEEEERDELEGEQGEEEEEDEEDALEAGAGGGNARGKRRADQDSSSEEGGQIERQGGGEEEEEDGDEDEDEEDSERDELARPTFPLLQPRARYVSQAFVRNRWAPLTEPAQERVRALFLSVERPLAAVHRDERRRVEAQVALGQVTRTLARRLPRMPFPPNAKEWHFDYEALLRGNRALEQQLTPALHAVALLKAEIAREAAALETDAADLAALERNAKAEERVLKRHTAKSHPLLTPPSSSDVEDGPEQIMLADTAPTPDTIGGAALDGELVPELEPLVQQLQNHLDSMEANVVQVAGIADGVARSAAKLDALLWRRLGGEAYKSLPAL